MRHTVLLLDDEPDVTEVLRLSLLKEPYEILSTTSAKEALEILKTQSVDVVVSDEDMPGMSGSEFLALVYKKYPDVIRMMLTGQPSLEVAIRAINEGHIYRFFTKPCNVADLIISIRQALRQRDLMEKSQRLLKTAKQQSGVLESVEEKHPGITKLKKDTEGRILIEDEGYDFDELINEINKEVAKSEDFFSTKRSKK